MKNNKTEPIPVMDIVNQKGGTGKTTTCENLGVGLAAEGKKVLLVIIVYAICTKKTILCTNI